MSKINRENILVYFLSFVLFWFGYQEVSNASAWVVMVPAFMGNIVSPVFLVYLHGVLLIVSGLALIFNFYRRVASALVALLILDITVILLIGGGLNHIAVRDIGLFGMALALYFKD